MDDYKISFLIAAYNEEKYIVECIESCLGQVQCCVEVCLVDDGSYDKTSLLVESKFKNDKRVKLITLPKNSGKVTAFNAAYKVASGNYIFLIGADDTSYLDRASSQIKQLERTGKKLCWCNMSLIDGDGRELNKEYPIVCKVDKNKILEDNFIPGGTVCMLRDFADRVFPIPEDLTFEDWWIGYHSVFTNTHIYLDQKLVNYRIHDGNTIAGNNYLKSKRKNFRRHIKYYNRFEKIVDNNVYRRQIKYNRAFKLVCLEDSLPVRISIYFSALQFITVTRFKINLKFLVVTLFGLKFVARFRLTHK